MFVNNHGEMGRMGTILCIFLYTWFVYASQEKKGGSLRHPYTQSETLMDIIYVTYL